MVQKFKSVYFADYPASAASQRHLKVAFGEDDERAFRAVRPLSSHEFRDLIGFQSYSGLKEAADRFHLPVSTLCLEIIKDRLRSSSDTLRHTPLLGDSDVRLEIDPIHVTFRGSQDRPLQSWYPFPEGYAPEFVERILETYAPNAKSVLDPFSGTGTTPLAVAPMGLKPLYCEINPLLQFLTATKNLAVTLGESRRARVLALLDPVLRDFEAQVNSQPRSPDLESAYQALFGGSAAFFNDVTFDSILKSRSLVDHLSCIDTAAGDLLMVAILSALIPSSNLQRAGDLRFKTAGELERKRTEFTRAVCARLAGVIRDFELVTAPGNYQHPTLLCEDAKHLGLLRPLSVDAVVTSPPYLNGTNYFRNTKVELWFLRALRSPSDLARYRQLSITAGINDVTRKKNGKACTPEIGQIVQELAYAAYDTRIPKMVLNFFSDMQTVFQGLKQHLTKNALVAVDIGDSAYGAVHVQTDRLLVGLLESLGFLLDQSILLRRRRSRGGFELSQLLLVLRAETERKLWRVREAGTEPRWHESWITFKREMPHQQLPLSKRNWGHPLHSLCSYQGKMKPSLASELVRTFVPPGGVMLDPFAGVGTLSFEAALNGVLAHGFDISPAALAIAAGKIGKPNAKECFELLDRLSTHLDGGHPNSYDTESARSISFNGPLVDYFEPRTLREVLIARRFFLDNPPCDPSEAMVFASLLHILHGNRPYSLSRRSHPITPFAPSGPFEYRPLIPRLADKVNRGLDAAYPPNFVEGRIYFQDATSWWPQEVDRLDAVITSPPFFDSTRFHLANWMRLWFCGWEIKDFHSKPLAFVDERQKASFWVYESVFRQARERLNPGGVVVLHLGQSRKCDMANCLAAVARPWFRVSDLFVENVKHCESHGIRDKGTVEAHQFLVLE